MKTAIFFAFFAFASAELLRSDVKSEVEENRVNEIPIYGFDKTFVPVKEVVSSPPFHYPQYGKQSPLSFFKPYPFYFNFPTFSDIFKGFPFFPFARQPEETSYYSAYVEPFSGGYYYQYPLGYRYLSGTSKTPLTTFQGPYLNSLPQEQSLLL